MVRGRRAAVFAALAIAATAAVTAGCGGGGKSSALSLDPVAAAATKSQNAGAARVKLALTLTSPQTPGKTLHLHATGAIDGSSGELSFNLGSLIRGMGLPAAAMPGTTKSQLAHASMKEISLEEAGHYVVYVQLGFLASQLPGGKQWLKVDVSKLGKSAGLDLGQLMSGSQFQPGDLLGMLRGEGAKIEKVGSEQVGGTETTHYRVTVDVAKALESKGLTSPLLGGLAAQMPTIPENVWIDGNGLVRRIALSYGFAKDGQRAHLGLAMSLYDYGANISIAAPPSSQVFDATQLAQSGIGQTLFQ